MQRVQKKHRLAYFFALGALTYALILPAYAQTQVPAPPVSIEENTNTPSNTAPQTSGSPPVCPGDSQVDGGSDSSDEQPIEATITGLRALLNPDGTWALLPPVGVDVIDAVTDTGVSVGLTQEATPDGCIDQKWQTASAIGGLIHVFISRAIDTKNSAHSSRDNCIPVVSVLNLNRRELRGLLVEIEFLSPTGVKTGTSMMFDSLDEGEEKNRTGASLFVPGCEGLTGVLNVPYCMLKNGAPCTKLVIASKSGIIPLAMDGDN